MALLTLLNAQLAFGHVALLDHADFALEPRERIGIVGRNGTGKSSLLKILAGQERPDDGALQLQQGLRIAYVAQEPVLEENDNVFEAIGAGLHEVRALRERFSSAAHAHELDNLQSRIEAQDGWNWEQRVDETVARLGLDPHAKVNALSGGKRKLVALAQALVTKPDVLLLDEPTNHLDISAIEKLEELLIGFHGSVVTISHDRTFLDRVVTRIVELDRGKLRSFPGNFQSYVQQKEAQLAHEATLAGKEDRLLSQEEAWIRKGVEARRTRSQSRITRLERLRANRTARREVMGSVKLSLSAGAPSGKIVADLDAASLSFGDKIVIRDFTSTILRGDKVGIVGPNGAGKTTLIKLILGGLEPQSGQVRRGSNLQVAYFDQFRQELDLDATLEDFISPGSEWVEIGSERKHVKSYLGDFLFSPARAAAPVRSLSGGERSRLLLARLFARPANVLVLDEPTNDLDIETLDLLEDMLQQYTGTVFLVSHDRAFVDNVATSMIASEGDGQWKEYEGGIQDWLLQSSRSVKPAAAMPAAALAPQRGPAPVPQAAPGIEADAKSLRRKLSYKEQRELESLPARIQQLETEQQTLQRELADGGLYARDLARAVGLQQRLDAVEEELGQAIERWVELSP
ncbi:ATP-binding cassette domain-containing protein [Ramlibacter sp. H39-3-26]|uniref:ATP-binding cassette domain-containing protein n=1 Tax=Curvibacter soli TaxID=3031331 RepID=UPI0023D998C7|nr:ATP-binding cassette domain-containing protein [Ramlibacter sp. H39-3-26]MDF1485750.1 ATP-binding cassette domain-containing protein [Ramlibacter sp. H39-3-26]